MRRALLLIAAACLAGCFGYDMDVGAWSTAEHLCEGHGGLLAADQDKWFGDVHARCQDGANKQGVTK